MSKPGYFRLVGRIGDDPQDFESVDVTVRQLPFTLGKEQHCIVLYCILSYCTGCIVLHIALLHCMACMPFTVTVVVW
jgi:hypothetical protein